MRRWIFQFFFLAHFSALIFLIFVHSISPISLAAISSAEARTATLSWTRGKTLICVSLSRVLRDADEDIGVPVVKALDMRIEHERLSYSCWACKDLANGAWIISKSFVFSRRISRKTLAFEIRYRIAFLSRKCISLYLLDYRFFIFFREIRIVCAILFFSLKKSCKNERLSISCFLIYSSMIVSYSDFLVQDVFFFG